MASSTTNLDLTLPVGGENVSRQIINANNVKIDEAVGAVPSGTNLQSQVNALNNNITNLSDSIGTVPSGETVEGQISTLDDNKANYKEVDVSSYQYNQEAGAEALFSALPTTFFGVCNAKFTAGYKAICLVTKSGASYGSITYSVDYNKEPYYYAKNGNSTIFSQIALKSGLEKRSVQFQIQNIAANTGADITVSMPSVSGKTAQIVSLRLTGGYNLLTAWVQDWGDSGITIRAWNGRSSATTLVGYADILFW